MQSARSQCSTCDAFAAAPVKTVTPIITTRPMQLVMFDLFFLPFADKYGRTIVIMMIDHFTKFKWARALQASMLYKSLIS